LIASGIDLAILSQPESVKFVSGFEAVVYTRPILALVSVKGTKQLIVPLLEKENARELSYGFEVVAYTDAEFIDGSWPKRLGVSTARKIGVETNHMTLQLLEMVKKVTRPEVGFRDCSSIMTELRITKDEDELKLIRQCSRVMEEGLERLVSKSLAGMTEREISFKLQNIVADLGLETKERPLVLSGPHSALPHGQSGSGKLGGKGAFLIDFAANKQGYWSDTTRTFFSGRPTAKYEEVYHVVREAQEKAIMAVRPGVKAADVDEAAREVIRQAGYGNQFTHRTGHGIGLEVHERPFIGQGDSTVLRAGMVFTIEPGIYLPSVFGVRIEDVVAVTEDSFENLMRFPKEITRIE